MRTSQYKAIKPELDAALISPYTPPQQGRRMMVAIP